MPLCQSRSQSPHVCRSTPILVLTKGHVGSGNEIAAFQALWLGEKVGNQQKDFNKWRKSPEPSFYEHTNPTLKRSFSETLFNAQKIENACFTCWSQMWTGEKHLQSELFENNDVMIMWFSCPSFPQKKKKKKKSKMAGDCCVCERKTVDTFVVWQRRFQVSQPLDPIVQATPVIDTLTSKITG